MRGRHVLILWAFFGLAAAGIELAATGLQAFVLDQFVRVDAQVIWMTPLSYLAFLSPGALGLWTLTRLLPERAHVPAVVFSMAVVSAFSVLFLAYPRLHLLAIAVLSLGVSAEMSRRAHEDFSRFRYTAMRTAGALLVLYVLGLGVVNVVRPLREWRSVSSLPEPRPGMPNVLLLVLDTVRASSLSLYGHARETTPVLDSVASSAAVFDSAYSTAPWTLTSHATLFTGRYPLELSVSWTEALDRTHPTLAEALTAEGFETAGFVANLLYTGAETGLARGFQHYEDYVVSAAEIGISSSLGRILLHNPRLRSVFGRHDIPGRRTVEDMTGSFVEWLDSRDERRPFFAFLNLYDAHEPYLPAEPFASRFTTGIPRANHLIRVANRRSADRTGKDGMSTAEILEEERAYEASIAWIDATLGTLLDDLERRAILDNTIVIVTSDHGELFGEHGIFNHGGELYTPVLHVPLVLFGPGVPQGVRVGHEVSLTDLAATVLDLVDADAGPKLPGHSLAGAWSRALEGPARTDVFAEVEPARNQPPGLPSEKGPMETVIRHPWHYIRNGDGSEELYHLFEDPAESDNRAGDASLQDVLAELRARVEGITEEGR